MLVVCIYSSKVEGVPPEPSSGEKKVKWYNHMIVMYYYSMSPGI